jgi:hypothetical protein
MYQLQSEQGMKNSPALRLLAWVFEKESDLHKLFKFKIAVRGSQVSTSDLAIPL